MIHIDDIHSLTDFQRNTKAYVKRLKETGRPQVLTVNGKAEVIVQDAKSYQIMVEQIERLQVSREGSKTEVSTSDSPVPGLI